jgi:hypothetical protein
MKNWLIISHAFNMDGRAASQQITDKIPYLLDAGICPTVLSAVTGEKDQRFSHYQLLPWGPSGLRFDFRHWYSKKYGRGIWYKLFSGLVSLFLLPPLILERLIFGLSSQSSWALPAFIRGYYLIRRGKIDLIYSTGGAWSAHYAGWMLKKITGVKWIVEIHDPMVLRNDESDVGLKPKKNRDKKFVQKLEGMICRDADHVWWSTDLALEYAKLRHPELGSKGFVLMPGADPPKIFSSHCYSDKLHLCHFGSLANDRSLAPVMTALFHLIEKYPEAKNKIVIDTYGAPLDDVSKRTVNDLSLSASINAAGRLEYDPILKLSSRQQAVKKMYESDVLLLLHGDTESCAEYIPLKWFEYIWIGRPIFAITHRNQAFDHHLSKRNSYIAKTIDQQSINDALIQIYKDWLRQDLRVPKVNPILVSDRVQKILSKVFE